MTNNIDETELARLEEGARAASKGKWVGNIYGEVLVYGGGRHVLVAECKKPHPLDIESGYKVINALYIAAACNAVPALVAEVRRLRAEAKQGGIDYCALMDRHDAQFVRAEKLREKVEKWEWWEEVRLYDPWSEHPCCTACGNRSKRGKIFDCAVDEYEKIKSAAWRAVHAD